MFGEVVWWGLEWSFGGQLFPKYFYKKLLKSNNLFQVTIDKFWCVFMLHSCCFFVIIIATHDQKSLQISWQFDGCCLGTDQLNIGMKITYIGQLLPVQTFFIPIVQWTLLCTVLHCI